MAYGFEVLNSSGFIQFDDNTIHYRIHTEGTITTTSGIQKNSIKYPRGGVVFFRPGAATGYSTALCWSAMIHQFSATQDEVFFFAHPKGNNNLVPSLPVSYIIYIPTQTTDQQLTGYGVNIYKANGQPMFSSGVTKSLPIKQVGVVTTAKLAGSGTVTLVRKSLTVAVNPLDQNYAIASSMHVAYEQGKTTLVNGSLVLGTSPVFTHRIDDINSTVATKLYSFFEVIFKSTSSFEFVSGDTARPLPPAYYANVRSTYNCLIGINR
jgi:hypothetical protein